MGVFFCKYILWLSSFCISLFLTIKTSHIMKKTKEVTEILDMIQVEIDSIENTMSIKDITKLYPEDCETWKTELELLKFLKAGILNKVFQSIKEKHLAVSE